MHPGVRHIELSAKTGEGIDGVARLARADRDPRAGGGLTEMLATPAVDELIERRTVANERFFAAEAGRIAELCGLLADRFVAGGRLLAVRRLARRIARTRATSRSSSCTR